MQYRCQNFGTLLHICLIHEALVDQRLDVEAVVDAVAVLLLVAVPGPRLALVHGVQRVEGGLQVAQLGLSLVQALREAEYLKQMRDIR